MAKFKISLLTPVADETTNFFLADVISDFTSQTLEHNSIQADDTIYRSKNDYTTEEIPSHSFCHTYNEKISFHQNAQKDLTFSMDRKIFDHDEWFNNPFVSALHVGSLLQVEDKYEHQYLFIIKKIAYSFKEHNIVYNYTCQDAFSYQHTRQQSGYTIKNDAAAEDFIGPKTIDWWVIKKIVPECYVQYNYIPINIGLYKNLSTGEILPFTLQDRENWNDGVLRKILKEPFQSMDGDIDEYQTTFAFSCSNSNANAALISLGENLDLMLHTYEDSIQEQNQIKLLRYFWFEPKQNQEVSGLKYSPTSQVSNFGLDFAGDSLTTVLNVNSHNIGDDLITLLPSTPGFFTSLFMSKGWDSSKYYPGYFSSLVNGERYSSLNNEKDNYIQLYNENQLVAFTDTEQHVIGYILYNFTLPSLYNKFTDSWSREKYSIIQYDSIDYSSQEIAYRLFIYRKGDEKDEYVTEFAEGQPIDERWLGQTFDGEEYYIVLGFRFEGADISKFGKPVFYLSFYRDFTEEEKEFAYIADHCPWLENRLIDFSYFLQQKIISPLEYARLMDKLQNDLRIVNGKLMYHTDAYYRAISTKTKILAELTNKLDALGAAFDNDIVRPIYNGGKPDKIHNLIEAYGEVFKFTEDHIPIVNYNEVLSDYFTKYMGAEQRFLKNMYAFRDYFNSPCSFTNDADAGVYQIRLNTTNPTSSDAKFVSLVQPTFSPWNPLTQELDSYYVVRWDGKQYKPNNIVTSSNELRFYKSTISGGEFIELDKQAHYDGTYKEGNSYFITQEQYESLFSHKPRSIESIEKYVSDDTTWYKLTDDELLRLVIYKSTNKYYVPDTNQYTPLDWVRLSARQINRHISWYTLPGLADYWEQETTYDNKWHNIVHWDGGEKDESQAGFLWSYYKSFFPVDEIYWQGPDYSLEYKTTNNSTTTAVLSGGNEMEYYAIPFISNGLLLHSWGPLTNDEAVYRKQQLKEAFPYYTRHAGFWKKDIRTYKSFEGYGNKPMRKVNIWQWELGTGMYTIYADMSKKIVESVYDWDDWDDTKAKRQYDAFRFDSYYANYVKSETAAEESQRNLALTLKLNGGNRIPEPLHKYYLTDDDYAWTTKKHITKGYRIETVKGTPVPTTWYQYYNFYKYIAATYSFRRLPRNYNHIAETQQYDPKFKDSHLYIHNRYLKFIQKGEKIYLDRHYMVIPVFERVRDNEEHDPKKPVDYQAIWEAGYNETHAILTKPYYNYINWLKGDDVKHQEQNPFTVSEDDFFTSVDYFTKRLSSITWYPLYDLGQDVNPRQFTSRDVESLELEEFVEAYFNEESDFGELKVQYADNGYIIQVTTYEDQARTKWATFGQYVVCAIEDYDRAILGKTDSYVNPDNYTVNVLTTTLKLNRVYDEQDKRVNLLYEPGILMPLVEELHLAMMSQQNDIFIPLQSGDVSNENLNFYYKDGEDYYRTYSLAQLITDANLPQTSRKLEHLYFYLAGSEVEEYYLQKQTTFKPTLYLCEFNNTDNTVNINAHKYAHEYELDFTDNSPIEVTLTSDNGTTYTSTITRTIVNEADAPKFVNMTNGEFWYFYHTRLEWPTIFEYAAAVESQLETYWMQAYTASKYCKYFLPEHWQPRSGEVVNHFADKILIVTNNANDSYNHVIVHDYYVPQVDVYVNLGYEADTKYFTTNHYLPKYNWSYQPQITNTIADFDAYQPNLDINYQRASDLEVIRKNPAIAQIMEHLNTNLDDWLVTEAGYTVYYVATDNTTGMLWKNLANEMCTASTFEHMDGLYGMAYYILSNVYGPRDISAYLAARERKVQLWTSIYNNYPFLLLEDNYSYPLATTSSELLKMSEFIFKGKKQPEKNYTMSLIDINSLKGYVGQELFPGQGIAIDANQYYDEDDDIYQALSQYLFITDVSYDLRNDASINITVNSIKYQEKLLQSLVKLIR